MAERAPQEELTSFREFIARLEAGELKILSRNGDDITGSEISALKRHISFVDGVLAFLKAKTGGPSGPPGAA